MIAVFLPKFSKAAQKLQLAQRKKLQRIVPLILDNPQHPSLNSKKMPGLDCFEARLDYHYRIRYDVVGNEIHFLSVGPHDVGLGKK